MCGVHAGKQFISIGSIGVATFASTLVSTTFNNANLLINGTLVVDIPNLEFNGCALQMGNGAEIFVQNSRTLKIQNSDLFSCDRLWRGIQLDNQANLIMHFSRVEDAYWVIRTNEKSTLNLFNVSMNKNFVGITNLNSKTPIFGQFGNNIFTCSFNLRPTWSNFFPAPNWSSAGMIFNGCTVAFGSIIPFTQNLVFSSTFDLMDNGIIASNETILSIRGCGFDTLRLDGIRIFDGHLNFEGQGLGNSSWLPRVNRCGSNGINARNSQLDVQNAIFWKNNANAIISTLNISSQYIKLQGNTITNRPIGVSNGIFLSRSSGIGFSTNNIIQSNTINMVGINPMSIALQIDGQNNATDNLSVTRIKLLLT